MTGVEARRDQAAEPCSRRALRRPARGTAGAGWVPRRPRRRSGTCRTGSGTGPGWTTRGRAIQAAAALAHRLERACELGGEAGRQLLRRVPGIGIWTAAEVAQRGLGGRGHDQLRRLPHPDRGRLGAWSGGRWTTPGCWRCWRPTRRSGAGRCATWRRPGSAGPGSAPGSPQRTTARCNPPRPGAPRPPRPAPARRAPLPRWRERHFRALGAPESAVRATGVGVRGQREVGGGGVRGDRLRRPGLGAGRLRVTATRAGTAPADYGQCARQLAQQQP